MQQKVVAEKQEKIERVKLRSERQKTLAQQKLQEEQEKEVVECMQRELQEINQKRSGIISLHAPVKHAKTDNALPHKSANHKKCKPVKGKHDKQQVNNTYDILQDSQTCLNVHDRVNRWLLSLVDTDSSLKKVKNTSRKVKHSQEITHLNDTVPECCLNCFSRRTMRDQRKGVRAAELVLEASAKDKRKKQTVTRKEKTAIHPCGVQQDMSDDDSDGESIHTYVSGVSGRSWRMSNVKSGFLDKPRSNVLVKHKWPHMNQDPRYVTEVLSFNELNFCQFVGGECRTILRTEDLEEIYGRLRVLAKIAYLYNQCCSWERARATYYAIVGSIEEGEASWSSSFGHYNLMCPAPVTETKNNDTKITEHRTQAISKSRNPVKKDYFCREYQKGKCLVQAPHKAWIRNAYEVVEHFCSVCYRARLGKIGHTPGSEGCQKNDCNALS